MPGESSYYVSNIHSANLGARFTFLKRADLYAGYSHVQDVGDGRATPVGAGVDSTLAALEAVQTFPLRYLSPQVRLSIRITPKLGEMPDINITVIASSFRPRRTSAPTPDFRPWYSHF